MKINDTDIIAQSLLTDIGKDVINICPKLTDTGYKVVKIPDDIYKVMYQQTIKAYYLEHNVIIENVKDQAIKGENNDNPEVCYLNNNFFDTVHKNLDFIKLHEDFIGVPLTPTYWYGPRVYLKDQILKEHIDHPTTHLIGSSLKIFSEGDEEWPLTFLVNGTREYVSLKNGEMVIFEAVRIPHGRPIPFKGDRYFGIFYHYKPNEFGKIASQEYIELAEQYEKII